MIADVIRDVLLVLVAIWLVEIGIIAILFIQAWKEPRPYEPAVPDHVPDGWFGDDDEWHVVPVDDLIQHREEGDGCACGPDVHFEPGGRVVVHHSLDGREVER